MKPHVDITIYDHGQPPSPDYREKIAGFLYHHLGKYGDKLTAINKAIAYALQELNSSGGYIVVATDDDEIVGVVVINKTGMEEYIPENILVYIASHEAHRGKGIGKKLMKATIDNANGGIALHVEPDNPAKFLYEKLGFTNKYLEMRLTS